MIINEHTPYWDSAIIGIFSAFALLLFGFWAYKAIRRARHESAAARQMGGYAASEMMRAGGLGVALSGWSARPSGPSASAGRVRRSGEGGGRRRRPPRLRELDPDFSSIAFEDLAYRIYAAAYRGSSRGGDLDALAPYLTAELREELLRSNRMEALISAVLVGSAAIERIRHEDDFITITVLYTSNVSYTDIARPHTLYLRERWTFRRQLDATTRPPEETQGLGCPSCGAVFKSVDLRRCDHCDTVVADARFEWQVFQRERLERVRKPPALGHSVIEVGTNDRTIVQRGLKERLAEAAGESPPFDLAAVEARTKQIFDRLTSAWNDGDLAGMRPLLSDALFDYMRYWLHAYEVNGLRNRLDDAWTLRLEPAKYRRDSYFQAITLRVFADGVDYTTDTSGTLVSGSRSERRVYSEYWTLIRSVALPSEAGGGEQCPRCGGPLALTMAGNCEHCGIHLTLGSFDWVLSKIEQDEVYRG